METYKIVRYYASGRSRTVKTGLTLTQAQKHCNDPRTAKPGQWFDGFTKE
jgi:hypothetical protein